NFIMACIIYIALYFSAPLIGLIFNNNELIFLSRWLFLVIPIGALNIIQITKIIKELNFKTIAFCTIIASTLSGLIGILCAYTGFGIWSLVIQIVLNSFLITILMWLKTDWRPKFQFSMNPIKEQFS